MVSLAHLARPSTLIRWRSGWRSLKRELKETEVAEAETRVSASKAEADLAAARATRDAVGSTPCRKSCARLRQ